MYLFDRVKPYLGNASWMLGEKVTVLGINFLITIVVARYLGPEKFGVLSYAVSLIALFASAGSMGLAGLVVRELVREPSGNNDIIGTTFILKMTGVTIAFVLVLIYGFLYEEQGEGFWVLIILALSILFQPFEVISYWFQSKVQAKYVTYAKVTALVVSSLMRLAFVVLGLSVVYFATAYLAAAIVGSAMMVYWYVVTTKSSLLSWTGSSRRARDLLSQGWVIYLGTIFAVIYTKIDQVMLKWMVGPDSVGVYAVAAQLSEAWYFVPVAIVATLFPRLIALSVDDPVLFNRRLQQIFDLLFVIAISVAVLVSMISGVLVETFFGVMYSDAADILSIHVWAGVFIFMRALFSRWILIENALVFSLLTQGVGAIINIILNLLLIPDYGAKGAAAATLISYAIASYGSLCFYKKTRPVFYMMSKSIVSPFRYMTLFWRGSR